MQAIVYCYGEYCNQGNIVTTNSCDEAGLEFELGLGFRSVIQDCQARTAISGEKQWSISILPLSGVSQAEARKSGL